MIRSIAESINPDLYAERLHEAVKQRESWLKSFPIFFYNDALFPGARLDLHLFEPRYRLMMQRIINTTREFAYVPNFSNYQSRAGDVALVASLTEAVSIFSFFVTILT
jgi:Lon protease-like protein